MFIFEKTAGSQVATPEQSDSSEMDLFDEALNGDLIDEEGNWALAGDDEQNRCLSGFYGGTHSDRGLRCVRQVGDHRHHLSEKDWWGVSLMWKDDQPEATSHYLTRPSRKSKRAARRSTLRVFLLKNQKALGG